MGSTSVILPGTNEITPIHLAEKLRSVVRNVLINCDQGQFCVTASFGAAELSVSDVKFDDGVSRADLALYLAKRLGRDRVQSFMSVQYENSKAN